MHCLPIRRNIVASDDVLDNSNSLVIEQANNRTFAAQGCLKNPTRSCLNSILSNRWYYN